MAIPFPYFRPHPPTYLIHNHLLSTATPLPSLDDGLQKLEVLYIPTLLDAIDKVLDLYFGDLAAEEGVVEEDLCQGVSLHQLGRRR
jgi:hypothetical protein